MPATLASNIRIADDAANLGKRIRTQIRNVGGVDVYEHFYVEERRESVLGVYRYAQAQGTVLAAAQNGTTTGMLWGHVPAAVVGKAARLRRVGVTSHHSTALATPTAPRLTIARLTAAAALNTTLLTPVKVRSAHPAPVMLLSAVMTGLTSVALVGPMGAAGLAGALTAVGAYEPCYKDLVDPAADEDEWPVFLAGEGWVIYQDTAGTTSDTRKFNIQLLFDEIEV